MSYPFVFDWKGQFYLVPESASADCVLLYKAEDFPFKWKQEKILLEGVKVYDSTLHYHSDNNWYLFCTVKPDDRYSSDAYLHIYISSNLGTGSFRPHPMNPIYRHSGKSRMAGSVFHDEVSGNLIRPAQNCIPHYGASITFYRITELSENSFHEELYEVQHAPVWARSTHSFNQLKNWQVTDVQKSRISLMK